MPLSKRIEPRILLKAFLKRESEIVRGNKIAPRLDPVWHTIAADVHYAYKPSSLHIWASEKFYRNVLLGRDKKNKITTEAVGASESTKKRKVSTTRGTVRGLKIVDRHIIAAAILKRKFEIVRLNNKLAAVNDPVWCAIAAELKDTSKIIVSPRTLHNIASEKEVYDRIIVDSKNKVVDAKPRVNNDVSIRKNDGIDTRVLEEALTNPLKTIMQLIKEKKRLTEELQRRGPSIAEDDIIVLD